jgi:hypothetical protein
MSSRLHHKWHRHNHHTNPTPDLNLPDSGHDPIASPESPFQGDFILNGSLSASQTGQFTGSPAIILQSENLSLSANKNAFIGGTITTREIRVNGIRCINPSDEPNKFPREFPFSPVINTGQFLEIIIENQSYYIPLWQA